MGIWLLLTMQTIIQTLSMFPSKINRITVIDTRKDLQAAATDIITLSKLRYCNI